MKMVKESEIEPLVNDLLEGTLMMMELVDLAAHEPIRYEKWVECYQKIRIPTMEIASCLT